MPAYTKRAFHSLVAALNTPRPRTSFHSLLTKIAQSYGIDWMRTHGAEAGGQIAGGYMPARVQTAGWQRNPWLAYPAAAGAVFSGYPMAGSRMLQPMRPGPMSQNLFGSAEQPAAAPTAMDTLGGYADKALPIAGLAGGAGVVASGAGKAMARMAPQTAQTLERTSGQLMRGAGRFFKPYAAFDTARQMYNMRNDPNATAKDIARTGMSTAGDWAGMFGPAGSAVQGATYLADRDWQTKQYLDQQIDTSGGVGAMAGNAFTGVYNPFKAIGSYMDVATQARNARQQELWSNEDWNRRREADLARKQQRWGRELAAKGEATGGDENERQRFVRRWADTHDPQRMAALAAQQQKRVAATRSGPTGMPVGTPEAIPVPGTVPVGSTAKPAYVLSDMISGRVIARKVAAQLMDAAQNLKDNGQQIARQNAKSKSREPLAQGLPISHQVKAYGSQSDNRTGMGLPPRTPVQTTPGNTVTSVVAGGATS